jgi:hypothetical protein
MAYALLLGVWAFLFCVEQAYAQSQKMHAILVGDTLDASIGVGIRKNLDNMNSFLNSVRTVGAISTEITEIKDDTFNCKSIQQAVERLNVDPNDTLFFYYSGHGFRRDTTQTKFPEFDCRRTSDPDRAELAGIVNDLVQSKKPKFLLAVADTCNKEITASIAAPAAAFEASEADKRAAFKRLFGGYSGTLMMSGSVPGEYSWYMVAGSTLGGFFTNQFRQAIVQKISEQGPRTRWEDIAVDATRPIFIPQLAGPTYQNPQFAALNLVAPQ